MSGWIVRVERSGGVLARYVGAGGDLTTNPLRAELMSKETAEAVAERLMRREDVWEVTGKEVRW